MLLYYLWSNRRRNRFCGRPFWKDFAKRLITLPALLLIYLRIRISKLRGADIGGLSLLEKCQIAGKRCNLRIGSNTFIGRDVELRLVGEISIGSCVVINSNVKILTGTHSLKNSDWRLVIKKVVIEDYAWIATSAIILPGVTVGRGAVVGAGALVTRNVEPMCVVAGNPARVVGMRSCTQFEYLPTLNSAPYEAWVGKRSDL